MNKCEEYENKFNAKIDTFKDHPKWCATRQENNEK